MAGAATAVLLLGVSIVACYVPARRVIGEGVEAALRGE